jgi:PncC family amidohydrolase
VAGSSDYFLGGAITYGDRLKTALLDVPTALLQAHGAVSEPVARAMAEGVRSRLGSDYGVAITGVAGPGGGSEAKPVGTVHLAIAGPPPAPGLPAVDHRQLRLPGDRERIRWQSTQIALDMLRRRLLAGTAAAPDQQRAAGR